MKRKSTLIVAAAAIILILAAMALSSCESQADVASQNISKAADQFEVYREIYFINGITGDVLFTIEGYCSLGNYDSYGELSVTCKVGPGEYEKHFLGLSDNVTYLAVQTQPVDANPYYHRVIFRPSIVIPDMEMDLP